MGTKITPTEVTYSADLIGADRVTRLMGNGRRTVEPTRAEVTVWTGPLGGVVSVTLIGRHILRSGERRGYSQVRWNIGSRWDETDDAPPIVAELIAALVPATSPEPAGQDGE